ncbi:MAG: hypothetical protein DLM64_12015 [Solirubrobacterales bacterium]|nr:MAG: hypothetical protein DLM64_12015 [Solirubrobacterales bacterium]
MFALGVSATLAEVLCACGLVPYIAGTLGAVPVRPRALSEARELEVELDVDVVEVVVGLADGVVLAGRIRCTVWRTCVNCAFSAWPKLPNGFVAPKLVSGSASRSATEARSATTPVPNVRPCRPVRRTRREGRSAPRPRRLDP